MIRKDDMIPARPPGFSSSKNVGQSFPDYKVTDVAIKQNIAGTQLSDTSWLTLTPFDGDFSGGLDSSTGLPLGWILTQGNTGGFKLVSATNTDVLEVSPTGQVCEIRSRPFVVSASEAYTLNVAALLKSGTTPTDAQLQVYLSWSDSSDGVGSANGAVDGSKLSGASLGTGSVTVRAQAGMKFCRVCIKTDGTGSYTTQIHSIQVVPAVGLDANGRLVLPVGLVFPGGGTQDAPGGGSSAPWSPVDEHTICYYPMDEQNGLCGITDVGRATSLGSSSSYPPGSQRVGSRWFRTFPADGNSHACSNGPPQWAAANAGLGSWTLEGSFLVLSGSPSGVVFKLCPNSGNGNACRIVISSDHLASEWLWNNGSFQPVDLVTPTGTNWTPNTRYDFALRKTLDRSTDTATLEWLINGSVVASATGLHNCDTGANPSTWCVYMGVDGIYTGYLQGVALGPMRFSKVARTNQEIADFRTNTL